MECFVCIYPHGSKNKGTRKNEATKKDRAQVFIIQVQPDTDPDDIKTWANKTMKRKGMDTGTHYVFYQRQDEARSTGETERLSHISPVFKKKFRRWLKDHPLSKFSNGSE